jgi:hypothetical protein
LSGEHADLIPQCNTDFDPAEPIGARMHTIGGIRRSKLSIETAKAHRVRWRPRPLAALHQRAGSGILTATSPAVRIEFRRNNNARRLFHTHATREFTPSSRPMRAERPIARSAPRTGRRSMAAVILVKHSQSDVARQAPVGFSWPTVVFGRP